MVYVSNVIRDLVLKGWVRRSLAASLFSRAFSEDVEHHYDGTPQDHCIRSAHGLSSASSFTLAVQSTQMQGIQYIGFSY